MSIENKMKNPIVPISFKTKSVDEIVLYNWIELNGKKMGNTRSDFIKKILFEAFKKEQEKQKESLEINQDIFY